MAYMHINNLYKSRDIFMLRECYAMEKIHGTSAHIGWKEDKVYFFSGGYEHLAFMALFDVDALKKRFIEMKHPSVVIYGEAYGGKIQGMKETYGGQLRFVAFEVKIGDAWVDVPEAESIARSFGLDFVHWKRIPTDLEFLDAERDADSVQAIKNGIGPGKKREGIVLRPLRELTYNNGDRIIAKYKRDDFQETKTPRSAKKKDLDVLVLAQAIADEWVTDMRLSHVLDKFQKPWDITQTGDVIKSMIEDVEREGDGEIVKSKAARAAISKKTAVMFKKLLQELLKGLG
jgi:hypothetical protein